MDKRKLDIMSTSSAAAIQWGKQPGQLWVSQFARSIDQAVALLGLCWKVVDILDLCLGAC